MTQPDDRLSQTWLASVHLAAATLALAWATTNLVAVLYHLERAGLIKQRITVLEEAEEVLRAVQ